VQMLERGWDAVRFGLSAGEFFFQVHVLVREDPALDARLCGELQRGECSSGPGWTAVEQCIAAVMASRSASRSVAIVKFSGVVVSGNDAF